MFDDVEIARCYEGNGLFAKIIDAPAEEALRRGFSLGLSDSEAEEIYRYKLDELRWEDVATEALKWSRLFGGAIIVMLIDDGGRLEEPLIFEKIRSIDGLCVFDRSQVSAVLPTVFRVSSRAGEFWVHRSRCLIFRNDEIPELSDGHNGEWGISEYSRIHTALQIIDQANRARSELMQLATFRVLKIQDLCDILSVEEGEQLILERLEALELGRTQLGTLLTDSKEQIVSSTINFEGAAGTVQKAYDYLSAVCGLPRNVLFGSEWKPQAFLKRKPTKTHRTRSRALGTQAWYTFVERIQQKEIKPNLHRLLSVVFQAGYNTGQLRELPKVQIKFSPLWVEYPVDQAKADLKRAQAQLLQAKEAQIYWGLGTLSTEDIKKMMEGKK